MLYAFLSVVWVCFSVIPFALTAVVPASVSAVSVWNCLLAVPVCYLPAPIIWMDKDLFMCVLSRCTCWFVSVTLCCLYNLVSLCVCLLSVTVLACLCWSLPGHVCAVCACVLSAVCLPSSCLRVHSPTWLPLVVLRGMASAERSKEKELREEEAF